MIITARNVRHALLAALAFIAVGAVGGCSESATQPQMETPEPIVTLEGHCEIINGEIVCHGEGD